MAYSKMLEATLQNLKSLAEKPLESASAMPKDMYISPDIYKLEIEYPSPASLGAVGRVPSRRDALEAPRERAAHLGRRARPALAGLGGDEQGDAGADHAEGRRRLRPRALALSVVVGRAGRAVREAVLPAHEAEGGAGAVAPARALRRGRRRRRRAPGSAYPPPPRPGLGRRRRLVHLPAVLVARPDDGPPGRRPADGRERAVHANRHDDVEAGDEAERPRDRHRRQVLLLRARARVRAARRRQLHVRDAVGLAADRLARLAVAGANVLRERAEEARRVVQQRQRRRHVDEVRRDVEPARLLRRRPVHHHVRAVVLRQRPALQLVGGLLGEKSVARRVAEADLDGAGRGGEDRKHLHPPCGVHTPFFTPSGPPDQQLRRRSFTAPPFFTARGATTRRVR